MTITLNFILLVCGFICFLLGAVGISSRINLVALGLAFWILTLITGKPV